MQLIHQCNASHLPHPFYPPLLSRKPRASASSTGAPEVDVKIPKSPNPLGHSLRLTEEGAHLPP